MGVNNAASKNRVINSREPRRTRGASFLLSQEELGQSIQSKVKPDLPLRAVNTGVARGVAEGLAGGMGNVRAPNNYSWSFCFTGKYIPPSPKTDGN